MKESPLVSIVVPVYNVESYIEKCLESLERQTYSNIEIVAVNDRHKRRKYEYHRKTC